MVTFAPVEVAGYFRRSKKPCVFERIRFDVSGSMGVIGILRLRICTRFARSKCFAQDDKL